MENIIIFHDIFQKYSKLRKFLLIFFQLSKNRNDVFII